MNYSNLKKCADSRKLQLNDIACHIGMSYQGLKTGIETGRLASDKVYELCDFLNISPNTFFEWEITHPIESSSVTLQMLQEQLAQKDQQITDLLAALNK